MVVLFEKLGIGLMFNGEFVFCSAKKLPFVLPVGDGYIVGGVNGVNGRIVATVGKYFGC